MGEKKFDTCSQINFTGFGAVWGADHAAFFEGVEDAGGFGVTDGTASLEEGGGGFSGFADDDDGGFDDWVVFGGGSVGEAGDIDFVFVFEDFGLVLDRS